jgi:hypothetical protein
MTVYYHPKDVMVFHPETEELVMETP